jgi:hypothetical protein
VQLPPAAISLRKTALVARARLSVVAGPGNGWLVTLCSCTDGAGADRNAGGVECAAHADQLLAWQLLGFELWFNGPRTKILLQ